MLLTESIRERHPEGSHHFMHLSFMYPQTSYFIHVRSPNTSWSTWFALHYFLHKQIDFCSPSPDRLWICCLTCSVLTESRSLSMDTVSKVHTGTPIKHPKSLQPLFIATDSEGFTHLCLQMQRNLHVVPAKVLALVEGLLTCCRLSGSVTTSALRQAARQKTHKKKADRNKSLMAGWHAGQTPIPKTIVLLQTISKVHEVHE